MFKVIVTLIFYFCSFYAHADYAEEVAAVNKGMPKSVKLFNQRIIECNHWAGEEPYDNERLKEINAAVTDLKCNALVKDEKKLLKKYKSRPDVIKSINKAKELAF